MNISNLKFIIIHLMFRIEIKKIVLTRIRISIQIPQCNKKNLFLFGKPFRTGIQKQNFRITKFLRNWKLKIFKKSFLKYSTFFITGTYEIHLHIQNFFNYNKKSHISKKLYVIRKFCFWIRVLYRKIYKNQLCDLWN